MERKLRMNFEEAIIYLEGTLLDSMDIWERIDAFFFTEMEI